MTQGAGRPGQPVIGQNSIFGGSGPFFTQMPTYTPVTRAADPLPQPQPPQPQPAYNAYAANPQAAPSPLNPLSPQPAPQPAAPSYYKPAPVPPYQPADLNPQTYPAPGYAARQDIPAQSYQPQSYPGANTGFPDRIFPEAVPADAAIPDANFPENFPDPNFAQQNYADASFPEPNFDASFPDPTYPAAQGFAPDDALNLEHRGYEQAAQPAFDPYPEPAPDYGRVPHNQVPPSDPRRQLATFDAIYDQPPQINLGPAAPRPAPQAFYEAERADADFLDESQVMAPAAKSKLSKFAFMKGKSAFMVASALLGAIALGGALAFAYKQSGGSIGETPVVQADNRPVKELPADAGGKDFPHKNKLIYDRLTNEGEAESEQLVPRQEDVAVPALPSTMQTAGLPSPVATTDMVAPQTTQAVETPGLAEEASPDGGPRRVKTMVVRPDGSVMPPQPEVAAAGGEVPALPGDAASMPVPAAAPVPDAAAPAAAPAAPAAVPVEAAAAAPAPAAPEAPPAAPAAPQQVAAVAPAAAPAAAAPSKYAVQLGAQKSQTEALAAFADIQQKNPTLLANYRPMVSKADLGAKGTLYRLRIGPIDGKTAADKLCGQLKTQGTDCFVVAQ